MQSLDMMNNLAEIKRLLTDMKYIAVVGLSPKESRPSNMVAAYMKNAGYTIYPVNPGQTEILGERCYPDLSMIEGQVDCVDIFRRSEDILPIVEQCLTLEPLPKVIWMQQGIVNEEAAALARQRGITVVMDRCIKVDHQNLLQ